jgi:hypothetical protein
MIILSLEKLPIKIGIEGEVVFALMKSIAETGNKSLST